ncbi:hypothetical protein K1719_013171 [Acacia pycnantha]|nr:hypothetical protein K1719_013171 [Acacia pycnantha]
MQTWKPHLPRSQRFLERAKEEDEDDVEEFQGFYVNTKSSSSIKSCSDHLQISDKDSKNVQVKLIPECVVVSVSQIHKTYALALKVKAPPPPPSTRSVNNCTTPHLGQSPRAPIDLVTVLDVGGSMTGAKLHMLKRAMRLVISSLSPTNRLSIVAFSP